MVPNEGMIKLEIYNSLGEKIITLADGLASTGAHSYLWQGRNSNNDQVPSGIYFYRLSYDDGSIVKKMTLLR